MNISHLKIHYIWNCKKCDAQFTELNLTYPSYLCCYDCGTLCHIDSAFYVQDSAKVPKLNSGIAPTERDLLNGISAKVYRLSGRDSQNERRPDPSFSVFSKINDEYNLRMTALLVGEKNKLENKKGARKHFSVCDRAMLFSMTRPYVLFRRCKNERPILRSALRKIIQKPLRPEFLIAAEYLG